MKQVKKLEELLPLSYFDKNTLSQFYDLSDNSLYANIKRWLRSGELIQIKKGLYVTERYYITLKDKEAYIEFLANRIHEPSYLSTEYVLQKYSLMTEAVYARTSITLKTKRIYKNQLGVFIYRNIKEELFSGFDIKRCGDFEIREATKAKALFDFLYLKTFRIRKIDVELIQSYRLNLNELNSKDMNEFSKYCRQAKIEKYEKLPELVEGLRA